MNDREPVENRRILIVDDNPAIHDDFRKILSSPTDMDESSDATESAVFGPPRNTRSQRKFELDSAFQGQEGVMLVAKALEAGRPYAMAFVDVRMPPGWDGVETSRRMWELDADLQVVLCTAYSDYSWNEMFEKLGQCDGLLILKKPFDALEASQLAHALTEKWSLHRQSRRKMDELETRVAVRTQELANSLSLLKATLDERDHLIQDLKQALANVKALSGLLPICAACKKIRDDRGYWSQVENYVQAHSEARFTHGMCPDCIKKFFPELEGADLGDSPPESP